MYLRRKQQVNNEAQRRNVFLRYLGEIARAAGEMADYDAEKLYEQLELLARKKTSTADLKMDDHGRKIEAAPDDEFGGGVYIVEDEPSPLLPQAKQQHDAVDAASAG